MCPPLITRNPPLNIHLPNHHLHNPPRQDPPQYLPAYLILTHKAHPSQPHLHLLPSKIKIRQELAIEILTSRRGNQAHRGRVWDAVGVWRLLGVISGWNVIGLFYDFVYNIYWNSGIYLAIVIWYMENDQCVYARSILDRLNSIAQGSGGSSVFEDV